MRMAQLQPIGLCVALGMTMASGAASGGNEVIPKAFVDAAVAAEVPPSVLYSIGLLETGQPLETVDRRRPFPWVLNVAGRAEWFDTQEQTSERLEELLEAGQDNVDVGLMQVNWYWHGKRFTSARDAVDPYQNLKVAAEILREVWKTEGNLWDAVGRYHSHRTEDAESYQLRYGRWLHRTLLELEGKQITPELLKWVPES